MIQVSTGNVNVNVHVFKHYIILRLNPRLKRETRRAKGITLYKPLFKYNMLTTVCENVLQRKLINQNDNQKASGF